LTVVRQQICVGIAKQQKNAHHQIAVSRGHTPNIIYQPKPNNYLKSVQAQSRLQRENIIHR
jgi:hypothetical protein